MYDEVSHQSCDTLAQTMSDFTYRFNETKVPKKHYKALLGRQIEEVVSDSVALSMVNAYYKTLAEFNKGNRQWFVSAMLYVELGVKPDKASQQTIDAVSKLTNAVINGTAMLNPALLDAYTDLLKD
ncbi:hypothetical protein FC18_GL001807 [Lacticaseibacillus sharpeae JCM 1186 = DSM 20505]|uniref:Uncharacterized protein n=2 Tax=Lacticaseibacillus sharpeae TaxID=1626 RepID=A0A0R1ZNT4_9LACO|nr:hypothetical protein FC18_GL001807 [Lacticaseibacillus sharpeae JCM 1186 = DSM 20505]